MARPWFQTHRGRYQKHSIVCSRISLVKKRTLPPGCEVSTQSPVRGGLYDPQVTLLPFGLGRLVKGLG